MMSLFYTYNRLFPGMSAEIMSVIQTASAEGERLGYQGCDLDDYVSSKILDRVDP